MQLLIFHPVNSKVLIEESLYLKYLSTQIFHFAWNIFRFCCNGRALAGVRPDQSVFSLLFQRSLPCPGQAFNIVDNLVDGADIHGLFLLLLGQLRAQHFLDLQEQLHGVDAVKLMFFPEIVIQAGIFDLELLPEDLQNMVDDFVSCHVGSHFPGLIRSLLQESEARILTSETFSINALFSGRLPQAARGRLKRSAL